MIFLPSINDLPVFVDGRRSQLIAICWVEWSSEAWPVDPDQ